MATRERDQRRARLEQLSDLDLTLMDEDYLVSLEDHVAAKDWQSAETLTPDLELIDELLQERGFYDGHNEGERKRREALLEKVEAARADDPREVLKGPARRFWALTFCTELQKLIFIG